VSASPAVDALVDELVNELADDYGHLGARHITTERDRAVSDLAGSVSPDALPEMAVRLAAFRLSQSPNTLAPR
jgi:hypothetical protein